MSNVETTTAATAVVERKTVSTVDFVTAWETSNSIKEVCEKTGMKYNAVIARANGLRNPRKDNEGNVTRGAVNLKDMPRSGRKTKVNVDDMNSLIERLRVSQAQA